MAIEHDDERITAYALGEMTDQEAADFEALLADDAAAQLAVDEVRAMGELLVQEFASEDSVGMGDAHRAELEALMSGEPAKESEGAVMAAVVSDEARAEGTSAGIGASSGKVIAGPWGKAAGAVAIITAMAAATVLFMNVTEDKSPAGNSGDRTLALETPRSESAAEEKTAPQAEKKETEADPASPEPAEEKANQKFEEVKEAAVAPAQDDADGAFGKGSANGVAPAKAAAGDGEAVVGGVGAGKDFAGGGSAALKASRGGEKAEMERLKPMGPGSTDAPFGRGVEGARATVPKLANAPTAEVYVPGNEPPHRPGASARPKAKSAKKAKPKYRKEWLQGGGTTDGKNSDRGEVRERKRRPAPPADAALGEGGKPDLHQRVDKWRKPERPPLENPFQTVAAAPLSTFSIDVDTASYAQVRQSITRNTAPPADVIRIEEMVNYFEYSYAPPTANSDHPFAAHVEVAQAPWNAKHRLVRIGLKGAEVPRHKRPSTNLVFLLDVSGSMSDSKKLPLMKYGMKTLVDQLGPDDRVAIVTYAGESGVALSSTSVDGVGRTKIVNVIDGLVASGSTNGSDGLRLAYQQAVRGFAEGGINRVVLASDGDFNVGISDKRQLTALISEKAKSGVYLTVLGLGMGNYKDGLLETLADKGNGNYAYLDSRAEARKVLVDQMLGNMLTIAKDVKIQVEFNPAKASAYRLIGYENRKLAAKDFANDTKDAGEIGAGHTVTALYEVIPTGVSTDGIKLKYKPTVATSNSPDLLTLKLRYKQPKSSTSVLMEKAIIDGGKRLSQVDRDFQFAAAVAAFGMVLKRSQYIGKFGLDAVEELATPGLGDDPKGHRREFVRLVKQAKRVSR